MPPDTLVGLLGVLCGVNLSCKLLFAPDLGNNLWRDFIIHAIWPQFTVINNNLLYSATQNIIWVQIDMTYNTIRYSSPNKWLISYGPYHIVTSMSVTKCVGKNFKMLVMILVGYDFVTNLKSPTSRYHQHHCHHHLTDLFTIWITIFQKVVDILYEQDDL